MAEISDLENRLIINQPFFDQESQKEKNFGFGFSAYDGFWPSFDKEEANTIFTQAKIIKELCDFLLGSFEPGESFSLLSIRREAAGEEDKKFIGETLYVNTNQCYLLRDSKLVDSYVFEISFTGKTKDCRTFVNQLRPPYCLRSLRVERQDLEDTEKQQISIGCSGRIHQSQKSYQSFVILLQNLL